jgi:hypothetical protein
MAIRTVSRGRLLLDPRANTHCYVLDCTTPTYQIDYCSPHPDDRVFAEAEFILHARNMSTWQNFIAPVEICTTHCQPTALMEYESAEAEYGIFDGIPKVLQKSPTFLTFKLAWIDDRYKWDVLCYANGCWRMFTEWVEELAPTTGEYDETTRKNAPTGAEGQIRQQWWWAENGKHFRVMDLPAELRGKILVEALGNKHLVSIHNVPEKFWLYGKGSALHGLDDDVPESDYRTGYDLNYGGSHSYEYGFRRDPTYRFFDKPNMSIPFLNKQIYGEIKQHLHRDATRLFTSAWDFTAFLKLPLLANIFAAWGDLESSTLNTYNLETKSFSRRVLETVRRLELDFTHLEFMDFFGVRVRPWLDRQPALAAQCLNKQYLPNLDCVTLYFRSTIMSAADDPWRYTGASRPFDDDCDHQGRHEWEGCTSSCQKEIADFILTYALDYVRNVPKVRLDGYIKDSTKKKWEDILRDLCQGRGDQHDMSAAKALIEALPL